MTEYAYIIYMTGPAKLHPLQTSEESTLKYRNLSGVTTKGF